MSSDIASGSRNKVGSGRKASAAWVLAGIAAAMSLAAPAPAQLTRPQAPTGPGSGNAINVAPPRPGTPDRPPTLWLIGVSAVLGAVIVGAALIPSKRGHQD
ncbi:MAG: hypothetical protein ACKVU4_10125 [Phycisphaerales bacterium]